MLLKESEVETFYDNISNQFGKYKDRICDEIIEKLILDNIPKNRKLNVLDVGGGAGSFPNLF